MGDAIHKESTLSYPGQGTAGSYGDRSDTVFYHIHGANQILQSTFDGVKNSLWKKQILNHVSATTNASGLKRTVSDGFPSNRIEWWTSAGGVGNKNSVYYRFDFCDRICFGPTEGSSYIPVPSVPSETSADNQAIARLYSEIHRVESAAMAGEDLGEIRETAEQLKSPFKGLRSQLTSLLDRHYRALHRNSVRKIVKDLAGASLEYRFGVVPITQTIGQAIVGFQNSDYLGRYYSLYGSGSDSSSTSGTFLKAGSGVADYYTFVTHQRTKRVIYSGEYGVSASTDKRSVQDVLRLRFRDVVPTLWNLIPWSWAVDYVTNVGTIADQFSIDWSGIRWMQRTVRYEDIRSFDVTGVYIPSPKYGVIELLSPGLTTWNTTTFQRAKQLEQPRPRFEIDFKLNGGKLFNLAAAIATRIPLIKEATAKAIRKHPSLPSAFSEEMGRRGERIPYPFHY